MEAKKLYARLEKDFIKPGLSDEWFGMKKGYGKLLCENFKKRSMGLVCDNTQEVTKVYTAVFPENKIMKKILDKGIENAMLFLHHPLIWDIRKTPLVFQPPKKKYLKEFKKKNISIYVLHVPLDNYSKYSTSLTLVKALGIKMEKKCSPYFGSLSGIIGKAPCKTIQKLKSIFEKAVGHKVKLYKYGADKIEKGKVAVLAGGGNDLEYLKDVFNEGIKTIITGVSIRNLHSEKTHAYEESHGINVLGGTHYSTEKFACIKMCEYFKKLGLKSEFISGTPIMEDM